jgi:pimeloyl-ACP methyl ester carboxylesterase
LPGSQPLPACAGTDGSNCQPPSEALDSVCGLRRWLIPDLIGHGDSDVSADTFAYKMESQAAGILQMLLQEGTRRCAIIAHSMGGPVAVNLVEQCAKAHIRVELLLYCEGNLDRGDCYHAQALARNVIHKELWSQDVIHRRSAVLFWSAVWLIKDSASGSLLPRLTALACRDKGRGDVRPQRGEAWSQAIAGDALDVRFVYGDKRRSDTG